MSRSTGRPVVLGIRLDRFDHQVEFVGAVDLARNAVVGAWLHSVSFAEVMQAINAVSGMIEHMKTAHERYSVRESKVR